jgi:4-hydroxy-tetrahydrodipicolinate reductase
MTTQVVVAGATGKMGRATIQALLQSTGCQLTGALARQQLGQDIATLCGLAPCGITVTDNWTQAMARADVCVDFTHPDGVFDRCLRMIAAGVRPVIGTTGLTPEQLTELDTHLTRQQLGGLVVPNFSIGAVLLMRFAQQAARYFDHAEIVEIHHNQKADAPSGTALKTAAMMASEQPNGFGQDNAPETELLPGARGANAPGDIRIHSVRLPGMVAHQAVLLSGPGQLVTLRHDSYDRSCYMPGVLLSVRHAMASTGLTYGLESLL